VAARASAGPFPRSVRRRALVAVSAYQAAPLRFLPIHLDSVAPPSGGITGFACDLVAVAQRSVLVDELVVGEPTLVSAGLLLMQICLGTLALGLGGCDPRLALGLLGAALAELGRFAVLPGSRVATLLQLALAPTSGHATAHREQNQRRNHQKDHNDDCYQ
jgi:hypothetical protein